MKSWFFLLLSSRGVTTCTLHALLIHLLTPSIRSCSNGLSDNTIIVFASSPLAPFVSLCWSGKPSWNRTLSQLDPLLISQSHSLNCCISWFRSGRASFFHLIVNTNVRLAHRNACTHQLFKEVLVFSLFHFKRRPCCRTLTNEKRGCAKVRTCSLLQIHMSMKAHVWSVYNDAIPSSSLKIPKYTNVLISYRSHFLTADHNMSAVSLWNPLTVCLFSGGSNLPHDTQLHRLLVTTGFQIISYVTN